MATARVGNRLAYDAHILSSTTDRGQTWHDKSGVHANVADTGGGDSIPYNSGGISQNGLYIAQWWQVGEATKYYHFGGKKVAMRGQDGVQYLLGDHLGSTSLVLNANGAKVAESRYYPYGETRWTDGTLPTDYRFTGQREESHLGGIYHMGARFYDPSLGRWLSADTIVPNFANPQDFNRYSYVRNSPVRFIDPTGHITEDELRDFGATDEQIAAWKENVEWWQLLMQAKAWDVVMDIGGRRGVFGITSDHTGKPTIGIFVMDDPDLPYMQSLNDWAQKSDLRLYSPKKTANLQAHSDDEVIAMLKGVLDPRNDLFAVNWEPWTYKRWHSEEGLEAERIEMQIVCTGLGALVGSVGGPWGAVAGAVVGETLGLGLSEIHKNIYDDPRNNPVYQLSVYGNFDFEGGPLDSQGWHP